MVGGDVPEQRISALIADLTDVKVEMAYLRNEVRVMSDELRRMREQLHKMENPTAPTWNTGYVVFFGITLFVILVMLAVISSRLI